MLGMSTLLYWPLSIKKTQKECYFLTLIKVTPVFCDFWSHCFHLLQTVISILATNTFGSNCFVVYFMLNINKYTAYLHLDPRLDWRVKGMNSKCWQLSPSQQRRFERQPTQYRTHFSNEINSNWLSKTSFLVSFGSDDARRASWTRAASGRWDTERRHATALKNKNTYINKILHSAARNSLKL